jgi:hypothetical protein
MKNEAEVHEGCESYLKAWRSIKDEPKHSNSTLLPTRRVNHSLKNKTLLTNELKDDLSDAVIDGLNQSWAVPNTIPPLSSQELIFLRKHSVKEILKSKKIQNNHILINFLVSTLTHIVTDLMLEVFSDNSNDLSSKSNIKKSNRSPAGIDGNGKINTESELMKSQSYKAAKKQVIEILAKEAKEKITNPENAKFFTKSLRFFNNNYKFLNEIYQDPTLQGMMDGALDTAKDILVSKLPDLTVKLTSLISSEELSLLAAKRIGGAIINLLEPTLISPEFPPKLILTPEVLESYRNAVNNLLVDILKEQSDGPALLKSNRNF